MFHATIHPLLKINTVILGHYTDSSWGWDFNRKLDMVCFMNKKIVLIFFTKKKQLPKRDTRYCLLATSVTSSAIIRYNDQNIFQPDYSIFAMV